MMTSREHTVSIAVTIGEQGTEIINVYAPQETETKDSLAKHTHLPNWLLGGDFDTHHTNWYGPLAAKRAKLIGKCIPSITFLINWTEANGLLLLHKPGHLTHVPNNGSSASIPDATCASGFMHTAFQSWSTNYGDSGDSDHALITTLLHVIPPKFITRQHFHPINCRTFTKAFTGAPPLPTSSEEALEAASQLTQNFAKAIAKAVPWSRPGEKSKASWTPRITVLKSQLATAKRQAKRDLTREDSRIQQRDNAQRWRKAIRKSQWDHWDKTLRCTSSERPSRQ